MFIACNFAIIVLIIVCKTAKKSYAVYFFFIFTNFSLELTVEKIYHVIFKQCIFWCTNIQVLCSLLYVKKTVFIYRISKCQYNAIICCYRFLFVHSLISFVHTSLSV